MKWRQGLKVLDGSPLPPRSHANRHNHRDPNRSVQPLSRKHSMLVLDDTARPVKMQTVSERALLELAFINPIFHRWPSTGWSGGSHATRFAKRCGNLVAYH